MDSSNGEPIPALLTIVRGAAALFFGTHNSGLAEQWAPVVLSARDHAVYSTAGGWYYVNEGWATQRRRGDTTEVRRHNWLAATGV
jgi:hypothetical protein